MAEEVKTFLHYQTEYLKVGILLFIRDNGWWGIYNNDPLSQYYYM